MSFLPVLFSSRPMRRVCFLSLLPVAAFLLSAVVSHAQTVYGDYKVVGTGADAGISFEFLAFVPPLTPGLHETFNLTSCTVPAGEDCGTGIGQVGYSAGGGQIRLTTGGINGKTRTWGFPSFLHSGVYIGVSEAGFEPGYLIVSGADATAGQPQSNGIDAPFQYPLEVTVNNSAPAYQSGLTVTFTAPGSGPSATLPGSGQAITDDTGRARLTPTANNVPGAYQITATADVGGNTFQTSFIAANVNTADATGPCQVTTANDDFSTGSLRYQVAACGKGGTITFAPGVTTVNLSVGQDIPLTQDLTIDGGTGVIINVQGPSRIFFISAGNITLKNLTLQNGVARGGAGGIGDGPGGGAAGMGGAIFVNAGSLVIDNVTFTSNQAVGGDGGSALFSFQLGGGGGVGGLGGTNASGGAGNGGGGGDFGSSGGWGIGGPPNGSADGAGGGNGGNGAFGGGGAGNAGGGNGGFGGGGGGGLGTAAGAGGTFGGDGAVTFGGGGGAGLGGAIFMRNGTLSLTNATFGSNSAAGGVGQSGGSNGQGKGGALYISSSASAVTLGALPTFNNNSAASAGTGTACNTVAGANAFDTRDICGILTGPATHFSVSAPSSVTSFTGFSIAVTALDANNNVVTGYSGIVHLTSTDPGFADLTGDGTLSNGLGTFTVGLKQAGTQTITATDTVDASITGTSSNILVNPGAPVRIEVAVPATSDRGATFSFTPFVFDLYGNVVTNYAGTLHFTSSDPSAALPADSTLTNGTRTFNATLFTLGSQTITATDTVTNTLTGTSPGIAVSIPRLVVTNTADSGPGSLRAALATAASLGSGIITFEPAVFSTAQTITLTTGTANVPSNTTIIGATSGAGASVKNLVTVSGGGSSSNFSVFTVNSGVTSAAITNLVIANGHVNSQGGGITDGGSLTVLNCTFANNYASGSAIISGGNGGGAIYVDNGTLAVSDSTFTGNTSAPGGAISVHGGAATIDHSTFSGNSATAGKAGGAIFVNTGATATVAASTFSGNSATGGGAIYNYGTVSVSNSILSGNTGGDCGSAAPSTCPANGVNGNVVGVSSIKLAPLGSYGGPTPTMIPLPGSAAICAGLQGNIASGVTTDQRAEPNANGAYIGYSSTSPCVDTGAVQTNYALAFAQQPSKVAENAALSPAPAVQLDESGVVFADGADSITIPLTLSGIGTLSGGSASTSPTTGIATYAALSISAVGTGDHLTANLPLNAVAAPSPSVSTASNAFDVISVVSQLAFSTPPAASVTAGGNAGSAIVVHEEDATGTLVTTTNDTITLAVTGPNNYSKTYTATAVNGAAAFNLSGVLLTERGSYGYTASISGNSAVTAATASETVSAATAASVSIVSGSGQHTTIGSAFAQPLKVLVEDQFTNPVQGTTVVFTAPTSGASAIFSTPAATASDGTTSVTATANGTANPTAYTVTANVVGATNSFTLTNTQAATTLTVTPGAGTLVYGQPETITATILPGSVAGSTPSGSVTFLEAGVPLASPVTVAGAAASYTVSVPSVGPHFYSGAYSGDSNFKPSAPTVPPGPVVVGKASSTLAGPASTVNLAFGAGGTIAVSIAGQYSGVGIATPSGVVSYTIGSGVAQTAAIASGGAQLAVPATEAAGNYTVIVSYAGDANYKAATNLQFNLSITSATLVISANNATRVYGTANPAFTGTVTGAHNGDTFTESFTTSATISSPVGTYAIAPSVAGANLASYTQSITDGTLTVTQAASATSLSASSTSITPGQSVTLTATVASTTTGTPTGTINFYDNGAPLNATPAALSAGTATYATASLAPGVTHVITAGYSGDTNFSASSSVANASTTITVSQLDFTITLVGPPNLTVIPGQSITYQVQVAPDSGDYPGTVNFAIGGLPPGASASVSPSSIPANGGPQTVTVTVQTRGATSTLRRESPPSRQRGPALFALAFVVLFGAGTMRRRGRGLRQLLPIAVLLLAGATAIVISGCGGKPGFFAQAPQNYSVTVTAAAGSLQHSTTITLNVQ